MIMTELHAIVVALLASILPLLDNLNSDISLQVQDLTRSGSANVIGTLRNLSLGIDTNLALQVGPDMSC
jgi:hypothetical protein